MDQKSAPLLTPLIWTFVWFAIVTIGINSFNSWAEWSGFSVVSPLVILIGLAGIVLVWTAPLSRERLVGHVSFAASIVTVLLVNGSLVATEKFYNTDAAAFDQLATKLMVEGHNPYAATYKGANLLLSHASEFWTYTLNGAHVAKFSYPAGAFLLQAPFYALGLHHMTTDWVDLFAWLTAATILYLVSPSYAKWLAPLLVVASLFTSLFTFGGTDALFVPFLMLAAFRWDDFVTRAGPSWTRWLGPVALGIACSVKQTPWFTVPFFLLGVAFEARIHEVPIRRTVARYVGLFAVPFVAINAPFAIWSPLDWLHGIFLPLVQPLVPDGQGLVALATHGFARVVHPFDLELTGILLMLALFFAFILWYPLLKTAWIFALPLVLFVPSRSLSTYLVDFVPVALVVVLTTSRVSVKPITVRSTVVRRSIVITPILLALLCATLAFRSAPLTVRVNHYSATRDGQMMGPLGLTMRNNTSHPITAHVMVVVGADHPDGFWRPKDSNGPLIIGAHSQVTATLQPPKFLSAPRFHDNWLVEVLIARPAALVTTPAYSWPYHNG